MANKLSRVQCLPTLSQIAERKKHEEAIILSDIKENEETFHVGCGYSSILEYDINAMFESYLNLLAIPDPVQNPLGFACTCQQQQQDQQLQALQARHPR